MENLHILIPFLLFLIILILLDFSMLLSLLKRGDERRQLMVWKASTLTLAAVMGSLILHIVESIIKVEAMAVNPFVILSVGAMTYFLSLLYYKKRYGD